MLRRPGALSQAAIVSYDASNSARRAPRRRRLAAVHVLVVDGDELPVQHEQLPRRLRAWRRCSSPPGPVGEVEVRPHPLDVEHGHGLRLQAPISNGHRTRTLGVGRRRRDAAAPAAPRPRPRSRSPRPTASGQQAAQHRLQHARGVREPLQPSGDIGPVRHARPRPRRTGWGAGPRPGSRTRPPSNERSSSSPTRSALGSGGTAPDRPTCRSPGLTRWPPGATASHSRREHLHPARQVEEQQPRVDQVEGPLRDGPPLGQVVRDERALPMPVRVQPTEGEPAERRVDVDAEDAPAAPPPVGPAGASSRRGRTRRRGSALRAPGSTRSRMRSVAPSHMRAWAPQPLVLLGGAAERVASRPRRCADRRGHGVLRGGPRAGFVRSHGSPRRRRGESWWIPRGFGRPWTVRRSDSRD